MKRALLIGVVAAGLAAASAQAQVDPAKTPASGEVVATAPANAPSQPTTDQQIADWIKGAPPLGLSNDDNDGVITATPDRGIHGEVGAFVSNRGYGGYVAASGPVGQNATVGVAVSDEHFNDRYFRGDTRSLAASLRIGQTAPRPAGCPAGVRVGDHYVEPVWASEMRGAPLADDPSGCFTPAAATAR